MNGIAIEQMRFATDPDERINQSIGQVDITLFQFVVICPVDACTVNHRISTSQGGIKHGIIIECLPIQSNNGVFPTVQHTQVTLQMPAQQAGSTGNYRFHKNSFFLIQPISQ